MLDSRSQVATICMYEWVVLFLPSIITMNNNIMQCCGMFMYVRIHDVVASLSGLFVPLTLDYHNACN